ncbi:MAG TPA: PQQ-binding-like beta-propeller repeat protein [Puia sp.]|nr:PQQ-binding-like beta-propeller repeat protein [Puia sp.]
MLAGLGCIAAMVSKDDPKPKESGSRPHTEWKDYGGGPDQSKFVEFTQINKRNIGQLKLDHVYPSGDTTEYYKFNPIIVDGIMYVLAKNNSLVALDPATGKEIWIHTGLRGITQRGINFWQSKDGKQKRLLTCFGNSLQAIDAITGKSILTFGDHGSVDLKQGLDRDTSLFSRAVPTSPGHIFENLLLLGSFPGEALFSGPGHVRAFDVITGKQVWIFHTIPFPGEPGYETWPKDAYKYIGGVNAWGDITIDEKRGIAYFPLGSPTYDYDGSDREGQNLYGNCVLALDARTGKYKWHFQTVHHDLWDYDVSAAPQLVTIMHDGKKVDVVAVANKGGYLYVLDRVTGKPIWPIVETPVPASDMPGEKAWPTQPIQTVIPPFTKHVALLSDLNPYFTAEEKAKWSARLAAAKSGPFQPLSDKYETISMPGAFGGANFENTASNPGKGMVYVLFSNEPCIYKLKKVDHGARGAAMAARIAAGKTVYVQSCQACHGEDHAGITGNGPSLLNLSSRVNINEFKVIVSQGKGRMPPQPHLDEAAISAVYAFLDPTMGRGGRGAGAVPVKGPVVENGPAPLKPVNYTTGMKDYPEGHTGGRSEYGEMNGNGISVANLTTPPWCGIACYDLNKGILKWTIGHGTDPKVGKDGLGFPAGSSNKGMVVTASGMLFATSRDGHIYGYDAESGKKLWSYDLQRINPNGVPAIFEKNGREYLVVVSCGPLADKTRKEDEVPRGYLVFALPEKK